MQIREIKERIVNLFFPRRCPICDEIVPYYGNKICLECMKKVKFITPPWCIKCGKKLLNELELCSDCRNKKHEFVRGRALFEYDTVSASIYKLKYAGKQEYAEYFGEQLGLFFADFIKNTGAQGIVPIPLHKNRLKKRGYNQAYLIARSLGKVVNIPVYKDYLLRVKDTKPLKLLNPFERQNNLKKAFIIGQNVVKLDTIIIIDDIYTTGSTIDESTRVLHEFGVKNVYYITLACGQGV